MLVALESNVTHFVLRKLVRFKLYRHRLQVPVGLFPR